MTRLLDRKDLAGRLRYPVAASSVDASTAASIEALWAQLTHPGAPTPPGHTEKFLVGDEIFSPSVVLGRFETWAWADLVLRALARETNLLLPGTRILLLGTGTLAEALASAIARFGGQLEVAAQDPVGLIDIAGRHGVPVWTVTDREIVSSGIDIILVTGRNHPPLVRDAIAPTRRSLVAIDGTAPGPTEGFTAVGDTVGTVRGLTELSGARPIFVVPRPSPAALGSVSADIRALYAVLRSALEPGDADIALAEVLLA
ncbi:hypothetical protein AB0H42_23675 [Nocardia sp. NPDC050799]|uniref:hypothetical protein n=1 Tax=Nocardia sp. NPDC050799 TaxID=3154842 RepID=UPI0034035F50